MRRWSKPSPHLAHRVKIPPNKNLQRHKIYAEITTMKRKVKDKSPVQPDASVSHLPSVALFVPFSQKALAWLKKNCDAERWQWENDNLSVEPRMADAIIQGMEAAGLVVVSEP
jgi:hypothetical protein